ncbi:MAG TPA: hypothetical protein PLN31_13825 [Azoarcus taiwanensis]|nr:hypothetical protein [Azoarcus taiwanensis]
MSLLKKILVALGVVLALALLAVIFLAYQHPDMLIDFSNLLFCG